MKKTKTIIIADHDITIISILQLILKENGFTPISTTSGTTCLNIIKNNHTYELRKVVLQSKRCNQDMGSTLTLNRE